MIATWAQATAKACRRVPQLLHFSAEAKERLRSHVEHARDGQQEARHAPGGALHGPDDATLRVPVRWQTHKVASCRLAVGGEHHGAQHDAVRETLRLAHKRVLEWRPVECHESHTRSETAKELRHGIKYVSARLRDAPPRRQCTAGAYVDAASVA